MKLKLRLAVKTPFTANGIDEEIMKDKSSDLIKDLSNSLAQGGASKYIDIEINESLADVANDFVLLLEQIKQKLPQIGNFMT